MSDKQNQNKQQSHPDGGDNKENIDKKSLKDKKAESLLQEELSEEDQQLKEKIELLVERLSDHEEAQRKHALHQLKQEISGSTATMTSVPKPLKFLTPLYPKIKENYLNQPNSDYKSELADLVSVLAMVASDEGSFECIKFCLEGTKRNLIDWGHEYLRSLAGEIGQEYNKRVEASTDFADLMGLVEVIIPYFMKNHEEPEAVDLLMEVESLHKLQEFTNETNFERVSLYLLSCAQYAADAEEMSNAYKTAFNIYMKHKKYPQALRVAQKVNDLNMIKEVMETCTEKATLSQCAFMLGRQRNPYESNNEDLQKIISNEKLSEHFKSLARDLDVLEPKHPDQIFKTHLEERKNNVAQHIDSAKQNLAATYVNAFVNAGYGKDLLMTASTDQKENWIYKNKEGGMQAAAASLGMILLWDIDEGLSQIDKYMESSDDYIVAGSYLAIGIVNSGIKNEMDPVFAILLEKLDSPKQIHKIGALMGLSIAYAGSARADLLEAISPLVLDTSNTIELQAVAALAIGMIYTGTCDEDAAQSILQTLMEKEEKDLENPFMRIFALGLGLLFLGQQDLAEATLFATSVIPNKVFADFLSLVVETCAYAGSGNVLKVQKMLHLCAEHKKEEKDALHQIAAVIGLALISFGEDIGQEMSLRTMNHLLQYGEPIIKRTVPLAIGLLRISNPEVAIMDLLTKLSYDTDANVSMSAIFALGLVGAGTNNSRLAGNLRYLAAYFANSPDQLFVVRIAQGLVHLGKGLMGLNPLHTEKFLFSNVSLAGLLTVLYAASDMKTFFNGKYHFFLYYLVLSIYPRMLVTLNENLEPIQTSVRVGMAVDTVGAAGRPKTITGFQTHDTPVLIGHGERAELATEEYLSETPFMENFVILKRNPEYVAEGDKDKKPAKK